jgi:hypothetical protein
MFRKIFLAISTRPPLTQSSRIDGQPGPVAVDGPGISNFIAMEYFLGILNRTYLVSGFNGGIGGARVGGLVSNPVVLPSDQAENPQTFVDTALSSRYKSVSFDSAKFLELDGANFFYAMHDVASISTNMARKWGMGNVRYSGRIFITLSSGKTREFILLGSQDVQGIADRLRDLMLSQVAQGG